MLSGCKVMKRDSSNVGQDATTHSRRVARILEIGCYPPPFCGWATRLYFVRKELLFAGHLCTPLNLGEGRKIPSDEYECVRNGWEYIHKILLYLARGYVVHMHLNGSSIKGFVLSGIACLLSLIVLRRPILTLHAGTEQVYFPKTKSRWMAPFLRLLFVVPKLIICNNSEVKSLIVEFSINPDKIVPITPFSKQYVSETNAPLPENVAACLVKRSPLIFTYLESRPEYALDAIFQAVAEVATKHSTLGFVIVGAKGDRKKLEQQLDEYGLRQQTLVVGSVSHEIFLTLLQQSTVYLRSNQQEGTSSSICEALYLGTPVIANDSESHPEGVITYPWGDSQAIESALLQLFEHPVDTSAQTQSIPDTVKKEAELLVRCALGDPWSVSDFST